MIAIGAISIPTINSSVSQRDSHQLYNLANFNFHQLYPTKLTSVFVSKVFDDTIVFGMLLNFLLDNYKLYVK